MSLMELCERCDRREHRWNVTEWHIHVGELHRRPHLCADCAVHVMSAVIVALRKPAGTPTMEEISRAARGITE